MDRCSAAPNEVPCGCGNRERGATSGACTPSGVSGMCSPATAYVTGWQVRVARRVSTATPIGIGMPRRTCVGLRWPVSPVSFSRLDPRVPIAAQALLSKPPNGGRMGMVVLPVVPPAWKASRHGSRRSLHRVRRRRVPGGLVHAAMPLSHREGVLERGCKWWGVHGRCGSNAAGLASPAIDEPVVQSEADAEFPFLLGEYRLSRQGAEREHRKQANPYATRLKCTVSRPACPSSF